MVAGYPPQIIAIRGQVDVVGICVMLKTLLHGQSIDVTYAKYPVLRLAIRTSLQAYKQALRKLYNGRPPPPFFYIDLNAGSGYNDEACCPGSPLFRGYLGG
jgi:hypothetical protein